jgi:hypothetical protein
MTPAKTAAITPSRASPLRMWESSCAITAESSRSSSASISPRVTVTPALSRVSPEAKALRARVSITARRGIVIPREMQSASVSPQRRGSCAGASTRRAPVTRSRMRWCAFHAMANHSVASSRAAGMITGSSPSASRSPC